MEVDATFVPRGKYRKRRGAWELVAWETALPSRLAVRLPADFQQQLETARANYHRFGQYSRALESDPAVFGIPGHGERQSWSEFVPRCISRRF